MACRSSSVAWYVWWLFHGVNDNVSHYGQNARKENVMPLNVANQCTAGPYHALNIGLHVQANLATLIPVGMPKAGRCPNVVQPTRKPP
eukprot:6199934-Pleurochrysis_carterae.AAC.2